MKRQQRLLNVVDNLVLRDAGRHAERYRSELCFCGGISTQRTLPYATPQETRDEVRRLLDEVGRNGGYFAAPAHSIPADAKPDNIAAMIDVLQGQ